MSTKESTIQSNILDHINGQENAKAINMPAPAVENGTPDIMACIQGYTVVIEAKNEDGRLEQIQAIKINEWVEADSFAIVVDSMDDLREAFHILSDTQNHQIVFSHNIYHRFISKIRGQGHSISDYFHSKNKYVLS